MEHESAGVDVTMNHHTCPVCGYNRLVAPPEEGTICPSCGTQFGYHDFAFSHAELRAHWLANGARWWSKNILPRDFDVGLY